MRPRRNVVVVLLGMGFPFMSRGTSALDGAQGESRDDVGCRTGSGRMTGTNAASAVIPPQSSPNWLWKFAITTGVVCARTEVSSSANRNSFHEARNAKIAVTARPAGDDREDDAPERLKSGASVDFGRLVELIGYGFEEARHQPDRERQRDRGVRQRQPERCVGEAEGAHHRHEGRADGDGRDHA